MAQDGRRHVRRRHDGDGLEPDSLGASGFELTHFSGNDGTLEGMVHRALPVLSCQYHPEASAGPHDARVWFTAFRKLIAPRGAKASAKEALAASGKGQ